MALPLLFSALLSATQGFQLKQINYPALLGSVSVASHMFELDRDSYRPGNITQQGMTFLIRGPEESEIGALSFYRQPGLSVQGWPAAWGVGQGVEWASFSAPGISWPPSPPRDNWPLPTACLDIGSRPF